MDRGVADAQSFRAVTELVETAVGSAPGRDDGRVGGGAEHGAIGADGGEGGIADARAHDIDAVEDGDLGRAGGGEVVRDGPRGAGRDLDEGDVAGVKGGIDIDARDGGATSPCGPGEQGDDQDRRDETSNGAQHPHLPLHVRV